MQDQKKNLSIFSFRKDFLRFVKVCCLFFLPVVGIYTFLEMAVIQIPTSYSMIGNYLDNEQDDIEVMFLGSSQIKNSINPAFIDKKSINLSSTSQHHNTDFEILKQTKERLPKLSTVLLEVSYGHFELPHNTKYFWKNNLFLKYYDVNAFGRKTFFKDELVYLSRPGFFSSKLLRHHFKEKKNHHLNKFGFDEGNYQGKFKKLDYIDSLILKTTAKIVRKEYPHLLKHNVEYFHGMLAYCKKEGLNVVLVSTPTYQSYNKLKNPKILRRRDSVIRMVQKMYPEITYVNFENDSSFHAKYYRNENHLNPYGAEKFSEIVNNLINDLKE